MKSLKESCIFMSGFTRSLEKRSLQRARICSVSVGQGFRVTVPAGLVRLIPCLHKVLLRLKRLVGRATDTMCGLQGLLISCLCAEGLLRVEIRNMGPESRNRGQNNYRHHIMRLLCQGP